MKTRIFFSLLLVFSLIAKLRSQTYLSENFNTGMSGWSVSTPTCYNNTGDTTKWKLTTNGWRGQGLAGFSLDSSEFIVVDSDKPGKFCLCNEYLTSPVFNTAASTSLTLEFDQYFRYYTGGYAEIGNVDVYNGSTWITVANYTVGAGAWTLPNQPSINLTPYINTNMQVRFRYQANWDWFWAIDNVKVFENTVTGLNSKLDFKNGFSISPNPSTGIFTIRSFAKIDESEIVVKNTIGQTILHTTISQLDQSRIDLSGNSDGVYFIEIKTKNTSVTAKIIKN